MEKRKIFLEKIIGRSLDTVIRAIETYNIYDDRTNHLLIDDFIFIDENGTIIKEMKSGHRYPIEVTIHIGRNKVSKYEITNKCSLDSGIEIRWEFSPANTENTKKDDKLMNT